MEIITNHTKLLIPYLVVDKNNSNLKTTLISLQSANSDGEHYQPSKITDTIISGYKVK